MELLIVIILFLFRLATSLRYKLEIKGLENLTPERLNRKGGILFLPNHPAMVDPHLLFILLFRKFRIRPVVIEYVFRYRYLQFIHRLIRSVPVPNLEISINPMKVRRVKKTMQEITEGLRQGDNFILWPAGRMKPQAKEKLGGASAAHALLREFPDLNVVLIRTTGLWGSGFSRAIEGRSPDLKKRLLHGLKVVLKNGIFFVPKRKILIEIEPNPTDFPWNGERPEVNRFLENWYNQYPTQSGKRVEEEPLQLVSYAFWKREVPVPYQRPKRKGYNNGEISTEIQEKVLREIRKILEKPDLKITPEMHLATDLGMDSLGNASLMIFISRNYDVGEIYPGDMESVQDVFELAQGLRTENNAEESSAAYSFPPERERPPLAMPPGKTIFEVFLNRCQISDDLMACGDDLSGLLSYRRLRLAALVLAQSFRKIPEEKVAVMLPASCAAYLTVLALYFANKIPVMLNWTLGPKYLQEMMRIAEAKTVITSWRFVDKASGLDLGAVEKQVRYLEDIRASITIWQKISAALLAKKSPEKILQKLGIDNIDEETPAAILFTSGTESTPKAVPLTHKNLLSNQRAVLEVLKLEKDEIFFGILPPFHSFGFSITGIFILLLGTRVAFYPDPTDGFGLARGVEKWKVTLIASAPTFMRGIYQSAKDEQLKSLRIVVTGAEKASVELYEKAASLGIHMVEGYGITECSPVISVKWEKEAKGVGRPLRGIGVCVIHPETEQLLPAGSEGEFCFNGPSVFNGYLGNVKSPFIEIEGKMWYRSGDIGFVDPEGNLIISGRLKRFTKVGAEMISLGAVEESLTAELKKSGKVMDGSPSIAILADESNPDRSQLILVTTFPMDKEGANELLSHSGFSRLIKISSVKQTPELPILGTGKIDYQKLKSQFVV